jgi:hypothetical protein
MEKICFAMSSRKAWNTGTVWYAKSDILFGVADAGDVARGGGGGSSVKQLCQLRAISSRQFHGKNFRKLPKCGSADFRKEASSIF